MPGSDEASELDRLLAARRRYHELREALPCDCPIDRDLRAELTRAIRAIDAKIAGTPANDPDPPPCAVTPDGRSAKGRARARRRHSGR